MAQSEQVNVFSTQTQNIPLTLPKIGPAAGTHDKLEAIANNNEQPLLLTKDQRVSKPIKRPYAYRWLSFMGLVLSATWLSACAYYVGQNIGWHNLLNFLPHELGGFVAGVLSPIALVWMLVAFKVRSADVALYAEALRGELQAMIAPNNDADKRINNDIERLMRHANTMQKASDKTLEVLNAARAAIKAETAQMTQASTHTTGIYQRVAGDVQQRIKELQDVQNSLEIQSRQMVESLQGGKTQWAGALQELDGGIVQAQMRMQGTLGAVEQTMQQLQNHTGTYQQVINHTAQAQTDLVQTFHNQMSEVQGLHTEWQQLTNQALQSFQTQRLALKDDTAVFESHAKNVGVALQRGVQQLYQFTDDARDQASLIETRLQGQTSSLQNLLSLLGQGAQQAHGAAEQATAKLTQVGTQALTATQDMAKLLLQGTEKLDVANQNATQTNAMLLHQNQLLAERVQQLATHGTVLLQMVEAIKEPLPDIAAATADIRQAIGKAQDVLQDNLSNLYMAGENTAHSITQSMLQSQAVLQQDLGTLQQAGESLLAQVIATVGAAVADATQDIGQSVGQAQTLIQDNMGNLNMVAKQLLAQVTTTVGAAVADATQDIGQSVGQAQTLIQDNMGNLNMVAEQLLAQVTTTVGAAVANATQDIGQSVGQAQTLIQDNIGNLNMVAEQLLVDTTQLTQGLYSQSEQVLEHVVSMANAAGQIDQTLPSLLQQLGTVSGQINTENTQLQNLLAQQQMLNTQSSTQTQNWQAQQQQLEQLHGLLQQTAASTMAALQTKQQHYAELLGVSGKLQNHAHALQQSTQTVLQQAGASEQQLLASVARVSTATEDLAGKLQAVEKLSNVESQLQQAGNIVIQQLTAIESQANNAALQLQTQTSHLQQGTQTAAIETQRLYEQQNQLRQELLQMGGLATTLQNAVSGLRDEQLQTATHAASLRVELQQLHADLTHSLQSVEQGTATHSAHAADMLAQMQTRVGELAGLVGATQNSLTDLAELDIKHRRTNFFNSTKFIVETLHSLAFDFSRMMQGDIDDKDYKNYQRGDTGIFTKRLLSQRDDDSKNRMRLKYRDDAEFRNYVQRYWRHYEEIINIANGSDDGTVLTPLFNSSDVGRLYQFLCQVLGRDIVK